MAQRPHGSGNATSRMGDGFGLDDEADADAADAAGRRRETLGTDTAGNAKKPDFD